MKLCSACLLGFKCRFDDQSKPNEQILILAFSEILIPVCPEQLGGLPTPREKAEIKNEKVLTQSGKDVTEQFVKGAKMVLEIAKLLKIKEAILKAKSPSCGFGKIYDGTFSNNLINGNGITAQLLFDYKIKIITEENL